MSQSSEEEWESRKKGSTQVVYSTTAEVFKFNRASNSFNKIGGVTINFERTDDSISLQFQDVSLTLGPGIVWSVQEKGSSFFGSLRDTKKQDWSIKFDSRDSVDSFTTHLTIAVGLRSGNLYYQDLELGSGDAVQENDVAGVKLMGFPVSTGTLGKPFVQSSKMTKITVGDKAYVEGLELGLIGMKKLGKRALFVPPSLSASRGVQPANCPHKKAILFIIEMKGMKQGDHSKPSRLSSKKRADSEEEDIGDRKANLKQKMQALSRQAERDEESESPRDEGRNRKSNRRGGDRSRRDRDRDESDDERDYSRNKHRDHRDSPNQNQNSNQNQNQQYNNNQGNFNNQGNNMSGQGFNPYGGPQGQFGQFNNPNQFNPMNPLNQLNPMNPYGAGINPLNPLNPLNPINPFAVTDPRQAMMASMANPLALAPFVAPQPVVQPPPQQPAQPTPTPQPSMQQLMTQPDTIKLLVEERQFKSQIDSKLDIVIAKVEQLNDRVSANIVNGSEMQLSGGISAQALLHTITRIVEDNERMHQEVEEKTIHADKLTIQMNEMLSKTQLSVDESNKYVEEKNQSFNEQLYAQKKKIDQLIDERESLQIEISNAQAEGAKRDRESIKVKQKYQTLAEELATVREELDKERTEREKEKEEVNAAKQDLSNFKAKYREENRKMNEAIQTRTHLESELEIEREKSARQQALLDERVKNLNRTTAQQEEEWNAEKDALGQEVAKWKGLFQRLKKEAVDRMQEFQDSEQERMENMKIQLRTRMQEFQEAELEKTEQLRQQIRALKQLLATSVTLSPEALAQQEAEKAAAEEEKLALQTERQNLALKLQEQVFLAQQQQQQLLQAEQQRVQLEQQVNQQHSQMQLMQQAHFKLRQEYTAVQQQQAQSPSSTAAETRAPVNANNGREGASSSFDVSMDEEDGALRALRENLQREQALAQQREAAERERRAREEQARAAQQQQAQQQAEPAEIGAEDEVDEWGSESAPSASTQPGPSSTGSSLSTSVSEKEKEKPEVKKSWKSGWDTEDDSDDSFFNTGSTTPSTASSKPKPAAEVKAAPPPQPKAVVEEKATIVLTEGLFDKPKETAASTKKSIFDDTDGDDDDLWG